MAGVAADYAREMSAAGCVLCEHHVAGPETANGPVARLDLHMAGESDPILPLRHRVEIAPMISRRRAKNNAVRPLKLGRLHPAGDVAVDFDVFEVRLSLAGF